MSASWVGGTVRARALARRRLGAAGARALATTGDLAGARAALARTPYAGRTVADPGGLAGLAGLQHQVAATLLWHLRVLAGWLPRDGAQAMRVLAGGFEAANLDEHLRHLDGRPAGPTYRLGTLQTAWTRLAATTGPEQVRQVLSASLWGDPGASDPWSVHMGLRLGWAQRVVDGVPGADHWARGAAALLLLREAFLSGRRPPDRLAARSADLLGAGFVQALAGPARSPAELAPLLPADARWVVEDVDDPQDLWRAEVAWWHRVERDAFGMLRTPSFSSTPVIGAVAVLAVDAWRVRAALGTAARGGSALEVFEALV